MNLSKKQSMEVDFLCKYFGGNIQDSEEYISATVHGTSAVEDKLSGNSLRIAKTRLDRQIKMWREGIAEGTLSAQELAEFGQHPFGKKIIKSLI